MIMKKNKQLFLLSLPMGVAVVLLFSWGMLTVRAAASDFILHLPLVLKLSGAPLPTATNALPATNTPIALETNTPTA